VNATPLGYAKDDKVEKNRRYPPRGTNAPTITGGFDERVALIRSTPQLDEATLEFFASHDRAIILEGTGLGHVRTSLIPKISSIISSGTPIVMTSSCINGMVDLNVYSTGRRLLESGVVPAYDMLSETAMIKVMWILHGMKEDIDPDMFRELFLSDVSGEISFRTDLSSFGGDA